MVIGESHAVDHLSSRIAQCVDETRGVRDARHSQDSAGIRDPGSGIRTTNPNRTTESAASSTRLRDTERPRFSRRRTGSGVRHHQHLRARGRIDRLTQPAPGDHPPPRNLPHRRHQHIQVARQLQVLKAIVQDMNRATELAFREDAGKVAVWRHADRGAGHLSREHQWLIAGSIDAGEHPRAVGDHDDAVGGVGATVAATKDGGPLSVVDQPLRNRRHHRRLAAATHREIADADDGPREMLPALGVLFHPPPADAHHVPVEGIKQGV